MLILISDESSSAAEWLQTSPTDAIWSSIKPSLSSQSIRTREIPPFGHKNKTERRHPRKNSRYKVVQISKTVGQSMVVNLNTSIFKQCCVAVPKSTLNKGVHKAQIKFYRNVNFSRREIMEELFSVLRFRLSRF
ncbi:hypothetical protein AVEN_144743-1 [Araneus ventricosus]|uniref:Uncharacterized protein n=1 Tax=Araneus ventricosus TaxID=182803 RepID=A0A4Y2A8Z4_ARAVE|nr:hypothetical protein AVEN_144743-1 [Araneus ventricosus]